MQFFASKSPSSTGKCRNCKVGHRDLSSNPGPHSCVCDFNLSGLPLHLRQKKMQFFADLVYFFYSAGSVLNIVIKRTALAYQHNCICHKTTPGTPQKQLEKPQPHLSNT